MMRLGYFRTRSARWLLMPWRLALPGHQQPWYCQHKMAMVLSFLRENLNKLWCFEECQITYQLSTLSVLNSLEEICIETVNILTHWGRATHICVGKLTITGSDNGLSPGRRQAIIWTNAEVLLIRHLGTNFSEILIGIQTFSFKKMHLKMSSAKGRLFSLGLNELSVSSNKSSTQRVNRRWPSSHRLHNGTRTHATNRNDGNLQLPSTSPVFAVQRVFLLLALYAQNSDTLCWLWWSTEWLHTWEHVLQTDTVTSWWQSTKQIISNILQPLSKWLNISALTLQEVCVILQTH